MQLWVNVGPILIQWSTSLKCLDEHPRTGIILQSRYKTVMELLLPLSGSINAYMVAHISKAQRKFAAFSFFILVECYIASGTRKDHSLSGRMQRVRLKTISSTSKLVETCDRGPNISGKAGISLIILISNPLPLTSTDTTKRNWRAHFTSILAQGKIVKNLYPLFRFDDTLPTSMVFLSITVAMI